MKLQLLLTVFVCLVARIGAVDTARPNILFVAIDDLNDWVGFLQGHAQTRTPNMDRLAARGVVFANAQCAAPLCTPSRAAVFSGRQPFNSGVYGIEDDLRRIAPKLVLLPQHLRAQGYRTLGTGKLIHQKRPDLFDEYFIPEQRWSPLAPETVNYTREELPSKGTENPRHVVVAGGIRPELVLPLNRMPSERTPKRPSGESFDWGPIDLPDEAMGDSQVADWAGKHLRTTMEAPFFLGVGFYRPHIPLFAPAIYFEPFSGDHVALPLHFSGDLQDLGPVARRIALDPVTAGSHPHVMKYNQWKAAVSAYLACIYFVDTLVGKVLDALDAGPHRDNTLIVLWGDHGWHLGEKDHWGKSTGWERSTRVPLVIVPAARDRALFAAGQSSAQPVSLIDLYPTLLELCSLPAPASPLDGTSLVPLLRDPAAKTGRAVITTFYSEHFSVRDEQWRYIRYADGSEELYDHSNDPNEWHNLAATPSLAVHKIRLAQMIPATRAQIPSSESTRD